MGLKFYAKGFSFDLAAKTIVMGILNITPDSFSDGGRFFDVDTALEHALLLQKDGADILDIGGQSTRPHSQKISAEEELKRIAPVLDALKGNLAIPISVDTFYPDVAAWALENGAVIINDVSGVANPAMLAVIKAFSAGYIIMHSESLKHPVKDKLLSLAAIAVDAGIEKESICLDVGIGFNKDTEDNIYLLKNLNEIKVEGYPLLIGASRKRFIGAITGQEEPINRDAGTLAAHTIAIMNGADIIRTHAVKDGVDAAKIADAILRKQVESDG